MLKTRTEIGNTSMPGGDGKAEELPRACVSWWADGRGDEGARRSTGECLISNFLFPLEEALAFSSSWSRAAVCPSSPWSINPGH